MVITGTTVWNTVKNFVLVIALATFIYGVIDPPGPTEPIGTTYAGTFLIIFLWKRISKRFNI